MIVQPRRITVAEFLQEPDDTETRAELVDGVVVPMMNPVNWRHGETQMNIAVAMRDEVRRLGLPCKVSSQALGVVFDERNLAIPDVFITCVPLTGDTHVAPPVVVVEVLSPSTRRIDLGRKLDAYLALPTLWHYLLVDPDTETVVHHRRTAAGFVVEHPAGELVLDPPGLTLYVPAFFAA